MVRVSPVSGSSLSSTTAAPSSASAASSARSSITLFLKKIHLKLLRIVCISPRNLSEYADQETGAEQANQTRGGRKEEPIGGIAPLEEIRSWSCCFDKLMSHQEGRYQLTKFLKSEFSDENILFWQACEELKRETNPEKVEEKARIIYEDFISILSPKEVSLDSRVREMVNRNMAQPSAHTFDDAQAQIYMLMMRDSYPRFLNSSQYRDLCGGVVLPAGQGPHPH